MMFCVLFVVESVVDDGKVGEEDVVELLEDTVEQVYSCEEIVESEDEGRDDHDYVFPEVETDQNGVSPIEFSAFH